MAENATGVELSQDLFLDLRNTFDPLLKGPIPVPRPRPSAARMSSFGASGRHPHPATTL